VFFDGHSKENKRLTALADFVKIFRSLKKTLKSNHTQRRAVMGFKFSNLFSSGKLKLVKRVAVALVAFLFAANTSFAYAAMAPGWVKLGGKVGDGRELGLIDVFVPLNDSPDNMWFADFRWKDASGPENEFNVGGGYRRIVDEKWIMGIYGYYDNLRSRRGHNYSQGTLGFEALTKKYDFRINGYLPTTSQHLISSSNKGSVDIDGTDISASYWKEGIYEGALRGFDAEVGMKIPGVKPDIHVYAGGYYFGRTDYETQAGPKVRSEWRVDNLFGYQGTRFTIDAEYTHDNVRDSKAFLGASVRIPWGVSKGKPSVQNNNESLQSRMYEPIIRDVDIVSGNGVKSSDRHTGPAINPLTNQPYDNIFFLQEGADEIGRAHV
jgi:hypothetical protein